MQAVKPGYNESRFGMYSPASSAVLSRAKQSACKQTMKTLSLPSSRPVCLGLPTRRFFTTCSHAVALLALLVSALPAWAGTVTWDAGGASPATPADGAGIWDPSVANWSNGSGDNGWAVSYTHL